MCDLQTAYIAYLLKMFVPYSICQIITFTCYAIAEIYKVMTFWDYTNVQYKPLQRSLCLQPHNLSSSKQYHI